MFLPTHSIWLVDKNGDASNCEMSDCSTKKAFRQEVKDLINYYAKNGDVSIYVKAQYRSGDIVLYECTIEECMNEED